MPKKTREKRNVTVTVSLTEHEKAVMEELSADWDIDMAAIGRRLLQHILAKKITMPELLDKYRTISTSENPSPISNNTNQEDLRHRYRISIRLTENEKQELNILANEGFYLPGELARILLELFISGVIKKGEIWR